ncbi:DUF4179 domain-containing protein [Bacillus sp. JJ1566]|uniref:DUF4179 domain-containing protein n=1 Tax=Bacillus sp. JJ1566 TaxID=3122961 RepID=UPI002FFDDA89
MIIAETEPVLIKMVREKNIGAIINWFDQRKESLYKLAWAYLKNTEEIQDVFFEVMLTVQADIGRQKKIANFEKWVISLFIQECKNKRVQEDLDDALILSYGLGFSQQEVAEILEITVEIVKSRLHKGIQSLSGVNEGHYLETFIDYLNRTLNRQEKIELEIHLHTCRSCQNSLAAFQNTIYSLIDDTEATEVPEAFLNEVITKLKKIEEEKRKKKKKRTTIGVGVATSLFLLLLIGYVTNGFNYLYYSWLDWQDKEDEQLLAFLKSGIGEPLNLVQESNGIKITIKSAIADEFQTLIYYEVENLEEVEQYGINFWEGISFEDEIKTFEQQAFPINQLPVQPLEGHGSVFKGTLGLSPVQSEVQTLKLNISRLQKIGEDPEKPLWMDYNSDSNLISGEWNFEIPVKKQVSIEHPVSGKITVDGVPIVFEKVILAPTLTALQYHFEPNTNDKYINELIFEGIETNDKTAKPASFGYYYPVPSSTGEFDMFNSFFDSLYFDDPKEILVRLNSMSSYQNDFYNVGIDMNQPLPQTFEYLGSEISIDNVELGKPTRIELSAEMSEGRKFESIQFDILGQNESSAFSMGAMDIEGVMVERNGKIYNREEYDYFANLTKVEKPRHYITKIVIEVHNEVSDEEIIPEWLQITGYQSTTYLDEVINLELK